MHNLIFLLSALLGFANAQTAVLEHPLQSSLAIPREPIQLLPAGTTRRISEDFANLRPQDAPDRSFHTVWLRMFPLLNTPLGDPYPQSQNENVVDLTNTGGFNIFKLDTGVSLGTTTALHLDFSQSAVIIGSTAVPMEILWIEPAGTALSEVHWDKGAKDSSGKSLEVGIRVRGGFAVEPTLYTTDGDGNTIPNPVPQWSLMNVIDIEQYLLSVTPSEVLSSWKPAMLQAQAIAARTYSLYQMTQARQAGRAYDMDPTTWYQSYRGVQFLVSGKWQSVESASTTAAVNATTHQAITYNDEVIDAYFSGNSGGVTCTASECFQQPDLPYLKQVADAPGVQSASGGTWGTKANITTQSITDVLTSLSITPSSPVVKLQAKRQGPSGRTWQLSVMMQKGKIDLDADQTKKMMHLFGTIRSFLYTLGNVTSGKQQITGHGYGHGVGMSQEGGEIFAAQGWSAQKILTYFYSGTQIKAL